jgi:hypothetical protein
MSQNSRGSHRFPADPAQVRGNAGTNIAAIRDTGIGH